MVKNYVDNKDMERKDEDEIKDRYEKGRTGYNDGEDPSMKQEFPGDEIVEDLRELSRQSGQKDDGPTYLSGENVQQENDRLRYGDSISKNGDKQFQDPPSKSQNKSND
ncbi:hypothetical protein MLOOGBEN_09905 [Bacillus sp. EB106-08-02-XG196]|jgi:hypothetical protein|uniref:hypothetical protein n=1 Tax=Bacillus sp. EB106-08-02-XG196 TaxID=2737049 RepID=UPI0015C45297|nr:hypothetical protein [Bacillus sp. EB106-08-02-XG196]NWQ41008.1 hypothetical protein [Bacillus sp. EB106-08-02-XG196]